MDRGFYVAPDLSASRILPSHKPTGAMIHRDRCSLPQPFGKVSISTMGITALYEKNASALKAANHPIVVACDEAYAMPLATMLRSLLESNRNLGCCEIVVLTSGFSADAREKVIRSLPSGSPAIQWAPVGCAAFERFSTAYVPMAYARLLLPHIFSDHVTKVLYLDVDVLVLNELGPIWEIDLDGAAFGAVVDTHSQEHSKRLRLDGYRDANMPGASDVCRPCEYFNSGVLLIDLPRWKQERVSERAMQYLAQHPEAMLPDQDALNVVYAGLWKPLDFRWNWQQHDLKGYSQMPQGGLPAIVHFAGRRKPWIVSSLDVNARFYDGFRGRTQFARKRSERARDAVVYACVFSWTRSKRVLKKCGLISHVYRVLRTTWSAVSQSRAMSGVLSHASHNSASGARESAMREGDNEQN